MSLSDRGRWCKVCTLERSLCEPTKLLFPLFSVRFSPPPGRFYPSSHRPSAGTQPGGLCPAGERHQRQGPPARFTHRCPQGRHQVSRAAPSERSQCWCPVKGTTPSRLAHVALSVCGTLNTDEQMKVIQPLWCLFKILVDFHKGVKG